MGEGGMVVTSSDESAERLRKLRDWGQSKKYHHDILGFNYRMDGFQGAILRAKLKHLEKWIELRREHAHQYGQLINNENVKIPMEVEGNKHVYYVYVVRVPDRDGLQAQLKEKDIGSGIHYPHPVHLEVAFKDLGYKEGDFPIAEEAAKQVLSLPLYPEMIAQQVEEVAAVVNSYKS